jgi:hypothetical protein
VLRTNYILKRRATRYVAAAEEEWLYPERRVSTTDWPQLDDDWFLFPGDPQQNNHQRKTARRKHSTVLTERRYSQ